MASCMERAPLTVTQRLLTHPCAEAAITEARAASASAASGSSAELATAKAEAESAKAEVQVGVRRWEVLGRRLCQACFSVQDVRKERWLSKEILKIPVACDHRTSRAARQTSQNANSLPPHPHQPCPVQAVRKEAEAEKARLAKAVDEAKKRLAKATKAQHAAEVALAEVGGRGGWLPVLVGLGGVSEGC